MMNEWRVPVDPLTAREIEILRLIEDGCSNQEIAEKLFLSLGTVKWYNTQIFTKLGVKNRTQAIAKTRELGLLNTNGHAAPHTPSIHQLPAQSSPFIGRENEVKAVSALLVSPAARLVSLIGPGGIGKTSLAVEVARRIAGQFPNGVYFVALSPLSSPEDILPMMANAVGFQFKGGETPGSSC
jgi:ATP/maltotriose-dependent transcriptional regulator MalT